jgi:hypothetical protein
MPPVFGPVSPSPMRLWSCEVGQDDVVAARHDDEERGLLAEQAVLDEDLAAGGAEFVAREHVAHGGLGLGEGLGDDHALARGEAVGLDDDGNGRGPQVGERGLGLVKKPAGAVGIRISAGFAW